MSTLIFDLGGPGGVRPVRLFLHPRLLIHTTNFHHIRSHCILCKQDALSTRKYLCACAKFREIHLFSLMLLHIKGEFITSLICYPRVNNASAYGLFIIMLSIIFTVYNRYPTMKAYCTDISAISLFYVLTCPQPGSNPGPFDCKSEVLPTEI